MRQKGHFKALGVLLLALLLVPVLALTGFATEATGNEAACYTHGDVNGDGVVDSRDAILTLYHSVYPDSADYFVSQDCDFNQDGTVDSKDAIYVLYSTFDIFKDEYPLKGTIHEYYDPEWTWAEDNTVQVVFKCGCGKTHKLTATVAVDTETEATCVAPAVSTLKATVTFEGQEYSLSKSFFSAAPAGHVWEGEQTCTTSVVCTVCELQLPTLGHSWTLTSSTAPTCAADGSEVYTCATCGETKSVVLAKLSEHTYEYVEDVALTDCSSAKKYACSGCGAEYTDEENVVYNHTYTAVLTKEATCSAEGEKTFTCAYCDDSYTEAVPTNDSHNWGEGVIADGVTTYTCADCATTKTAVCVADTIATVSKDDLAAADELMLQNASISLDESALSGLTDGDISVEVGTVDIGDLELDLSALADQIIDGTLYDFSLSCGDQEVSEFSGELTIRIPYELQEGDDVDCIDIWYINDEGEAECYSGTYSNGYVTFTTSHFSYYTVTRLTPAQRCAHYGHAMARHTKAATCTAEGFDISYCQRCGYKEKDEVLPVIDHDYTGNETIAPATCTTDGAYTKICNVCKQSTSGTLVAPGHNWVLDTENSQKASCSNIGLELYNCSNCEETYAVESAQLDHTLTVSKQAADCENYGYYSESCSVCDYEYKETIAPLGHAYSADTAVWAWAEDNSTATVTLTCATDATHTETLDAVVTTVANNCTGDVTYTATATLNGVEYKDSIDAQLEGSSHRAGTTWLTNASQHYNECDLCGTRMNAANHTWGAQTVIKTATCATGGTATTSCTVCGYKKNITLPATGEHNYVNGTCDLCGKVETNCDHIRMTEKPVDLSAYGLCEGSEITITSCECGENSYINWDLRCTFGQWTEDEFTMDDGTIQYVSTRSCEKCGLVQEITYCNELDTENCVTCSIYWYRFFKNDTLIIEDDLIEGCWDHATNILASTVDLNTYGLCGEVLETYTCHCGARTHTYDADSTCNWIYSNEQSSEDTSVWVCSVCGAVCTLVETTTNENCNVTGVYEYTYTKDGVEVYSYTNETFYVEHNFEVSKYELEGETCKDGVVITMTCSGCGANHQYYTTYHEYTRSEYIDLSAYDFCTDGLFQRTCSCGSYLGFEQEGGCEFYHVAWDPETQTSTYACEDCGLTYSFQVTRTEKDENCNCVVTREYTYYDGEGNAIATGTDKYNAIDHNTVYDLSLVEGATSCEDGARAVITCTDCDYYDVQTYSHHRTFTTQMYDLSEYGGCNTEVSITTCACGAESWQGFYENQCHWEWIEGSENNGYTQRCVRCGIMLKSSTEYTKLEGCMYNKNTTITVTKDGETLFETQFGGDYAEHRMVYDLTLQGETCDDGFMVSGKCLDCDYVEEEWGPVYGHETYPIERKLLSDGQFCGELDLVTANCACGEEKNIYARWLGNSCNFSYLYWNDVQQCDVYECTECGNMRLAKWDSYSMEDDPCTRVETGKYTMLDADANELFSYETYHTYENHCYLTTFHMQGKTCEDGYYITRTCADCGETYTRDYLNYGCETWRTSREIMYEGEDYCGRNYVSVYECACGNYSHAEFNYDCSWMHVGYDDSTGLSIYRCQDCGVIRKSKSTYTRDEETCVVTTAYDYSFYMGDELIGSFQKECRSIQHQYVCTFEMLGDTCEDGYYVTYTCTDCGESHKETYKYTYHDRFTTAYYDLTDYGMCGGYIEARSCPDGENASYNYDFACNWNHAGYTEDGYSLYYCPDCETYTTYHSDGSVNRETCFYEGAFYCTLTREDEVVLDLTIPRKYESHETVATFVLDGETCENGYTVTQECVYCDYTYTRWDYGHDNYQTEYYDMSEYGMCGGEIYRNSCACGDRSDWEYYYHGENGCDWDWVESDKEGYNKYHCADCNTYRYIQNSGEVDHDICRYVGTWNQSFVRDEETLLEINGTERWEDHVYVVESFDMFGTSCQEGYLINQKCIYCDKTSRNSSSYHGSWLIEYVELSDLSESLCGGNIYYYRCGCGYSSSVESNYNCNTQWDSWSEKGADGYTHYFSTETCSDCGFQWKRETYTVYDEENCLKTEYRTYTFSQNEEVLKTYDTQNNWSYHSYGAPKMELMKGAETCEDGLRLTYTCEVCGYFYTNTTYEHRQQAVKTFDLTDYGAVCEESYLTQKSCLCGKRQSCELTGDIRCDMDWVWNSKWIEEAVSGSQYSTEGYRYLESNFYTLTCAVTHPESCAFKIRQATYWLVEDCIATQYQTWRLGYDPETDTWQEEITVPTGNTSVFHNYESTDIAETLEDGTYVTGYLYTCADCGSTYSAKDHYTDENCNEHLKYEREATNTLDNGEKKYNYYTYEYGLEYKDYRFQTLRYEEFIYGDDSTYWYKYEYTYDFEAGCVRTSTYTNSRGETSTSTETVHKSYYQNSETLKERTCTQFGETQVNYECVLCGDTSGTYTYTNNPYAHYWQYNWSEGIYYCYYCGLENINGASGGIVIEDFTEDYGEDTNYVVGYWNRDELDVIYYVSVILDDVDEDVDNEILLDGVTFTELTAENDGITAISFSQEDTLEAAAAAIEEAEYTGSYAIRFTFVPVDSEDTLDYAITFDSLTTE